MMCAVSLPVTQSFYRFLPPLSIIHVYYSCRISPLDYAERGNQIVVYNVWGNELGRGSLSLWERAARQRRVRVQVWANFETLNFS